jgi:hypothetical protein
MGTRLGNIEESQSVGVQYNERLPLEEIILERQHKVKEGY